MLEPVLRALTTHASASEDAAAALRGRPAQPITCLLAHPSARVQMRVQRLLLVLLHSHDMQAAVLAAGAVPALIKLIKSSSSGVQVRAMHKAGCATDAGRRRFLLPVTRPHTRMLLCFAAYRHRPDHQQPNHLAFVCEWTQVMALRVLHRLAMECSPQLVHMQQHGLLEVLLAVLSEPAVAAGVAPASAGTKAKAAAHSAADASKQVCSMEHLHAVAPNWKYVHE